jgi:DNA-3-methyladenine glycosylase
MHRTKLPIAFFGCVSVVVVHGQPSLTVDGGRGKGEGGWSVGLFDCSAVGQEKLSALSDQRAAFKDVLVPSGGNGRRGRRPHFAVIPVIWVIGGRGDGKLGVMRKPKGGGSGFRKVGRAFYERPAAEVAPDLIGKILVRRTRGVERRARIVEAEAYVGAHDLACHSSRGRTQRTEVMFGRGGHAYVYLIYGMYEMLNIVVSVAGDPQAVLIRAAEPVGWKADLSGPGKLTRALRISWSQNGLDLTGDELFLLDDRNYRPRVAVAERVGIDYSGEWKHALLRFLDAESPAVSRARGSERSSSRSRRMRSRTGNR